MESLEGRPFQITYGSGQIKYIGMASVDRERGPTLVEEAITQLTDVDAETYVSVEEYQDIVLSMTQSHISAIDYLTDEQLFHVPMSDISYCMQYREFMGFVTQQVFGTAMAVGFVCHSFHCESENTAFEVVNSVGQAFHVDSDPQSPTSTSSERKSGNKFGFGGRLRRIRGADSNNSDTKSSDFLAPPQHQSLRFSSQKMSRQISAGSIVSLSLSPALSDESSSADVQGGHASSGDTTSDADSPRIVRANKFANINDYGSTTRSMHVANSRNKGRATGTKSRSSSISSEYLAQQTAQNLFRRYSQANSNQEDNSFSGRGIVDWLLTTGDFVNRALAIDFMSSLVDMGCVRPIGSYYRNKPFTDSTDQYYHFAVPSAGLRSETESGKGSSADDLTDRDCMVSDSFDLMKAIAKNSSDDFCHVLDQLGENKTTDKFLGSCLHHAVKMKSIDIAEVLLAWKNVDVNCVNKNGETPLHRAAYFGDTKMLKLLLDHGANINAICRKDGSTPIFRAAERLRNTGCAILLVEHGAKIQISNQAGVKPVQLSPGLQETQQRLCESIMNKFADKTASYSDMTNMRLLATNDENDQALIGGLRKPDASQHIISLCTDDENEQCGLIQDSWISIIELICSPGMRRNRAARSGFLSVLATCLTVPGKLRGSVLGIFGDLSESHPEKDQRDCLKQISTIPLQLLVNILHIDNPRKQNLVASRVLGLVSIFNKAQLALSTPATLRALVDFCKCVANEIEAGEARARQDGTQIDADLESMMLWIIRTLANISKTPESHPIFQQIEADRNLKEFLFSQSELVKVFAARIFIYLGIFDDVCEYEVLARELFTPHVDELRGKTTVKNADHDGGAWVEIKGASLEKVASILISESESVVCHLFFLVYQTYCVPSTLFRLLTYTLFSRRGANNVITRKHDRVLKLIKLWIQNRLSDFMDHPILLEDLKKLIAELQEKGGIYEGIAGQLLDMTVDEHPQNLLSTGIANYVNAAHHRLYDVAKQKVLSGDLPVSKELAVTLGAVQLYIDDLRFQSKHNIKPSSKSKQRQSNPKPRELLPPAFIKAKDMMDLVAMEYERICGISDRDAKHLYLHICQLVAFDYFSVKQAIASKSKPISRLLGISSNRFIILEDKTKEIVYDCELSKIARWEIQNLSEKGKKYLEPVPPGTKGSSFFLILSFGNTKRLFFSAELIHLEQFCQLLKSRVKAQLEHPQSQSQNQAMGLHDPSNSFVCHCPKSPMISDDISENISLAELLQYPTEFARQLTVLEHGYFQKISAKDLLDRICHARPAESCDKFIALFNLINRWVVTVIVEQKSLESRCEIIQQFIAIAYECFKLKNFNGVMEIVSALSNSSVRRLTNTWENVDANLMLQLRELDKLMTAGDNFKQYRAAVKNVGDDTPCVPYFGILLKDLTFLRHGNADYLSAGMLHVGKWFHIVMLLKKMEEAQRHSYNILIVPEIQKVLLTIEAAEEEWIVERSKVIQPSTSQIKKSPRPSLRTHRREPSGNSLFGVLGFPSFSKQA